jgi:hypothetical protein
MSAALAGCTTGEKPAPSVPENPLKPAATVLAGDFALRVSSLYDMVASDTDPLTEALPAQLQTVPIDRSPTGQEEVFTVTMGRLHGDHVHGQSASLVTDGGRSPRVLELSTGEAVAGSTPPGSTPHIVEQGSYRINAVVSGEKNDWLLEFRQNPQGPLADDTDQNVVFRGFTLPQGELDRMQLDKRLGITALDEHKLAQFERGIGGVLDAMETGTVSNPR